LKLNLARLETTCERLSIYFFERFVLQQEQKPLLDGGIHS